MLWPPMLYSTEDLDYIQQENRNLYSHKRSINRALAKNLENLLCHVVHVKFLFSAKQEL